VVQRGISVRAMLSVCSRMTTMDTERVEVFEGDMISSQSIHGGTVEAQGLPWLILVPVIKSVLDLIRDSRLGA